LGVARTQCNAYRSVGNHWIRRCKNSNIFQAPVACVGKQHKWIELFLNKYIFDIKKYYYYFFSEMFERLSLFLSASEYDLKETYHNTMNKNAPREEIIPCILYE
jgi:hypothetical protein